MKIYISLVKNQKHVIQVLRGFHFSWKMNGSIDLRQMKSYFEKKS